MYHFCKSFPFVALVLLTSACKKEQSELEKLPDATQNGANAAGCLIDGKAFVATGWGSGMGKVTGVSVGLRYDSIYWLNLNGEFNGQRVTLSLFLNDLKTTGTHDFNKTTFVLPTAGPNQCANYMALTPVGAVGGTYVTNAQHTGSATITTHNPVQRLVSGTFEFSAASLTEPGKVIRVTNGRFDVRN